MMHNILGNRPNVTVYLDDICIHTDTIEIHFEVLNIVFNKLRKISLIINSKKVSFLMTSIKLLGHFVSHNKVALDVDKIVQIQNRLAPSNVKELQVFLEIFNFFSRFINGFAEITRSLTELLKKDQKFEWYAEYNENPILRLPDLSKAFILYTDASQFALGVVLGQKDDKGNEYVVSYASPTLKKAELNYTITEKECLAEVFGLQQFRTYLYCTKFIIFTDHIALNWLMTIKVPIGRVCRWSILIQQYWLQKWFKTFEFGYTF